jgi:hypothetical protein
VLKRWQAARGYPSTGYLNKLQHKALLGEIVASNSGSSDETAEDRPARRARRSSGGGGGRSGSGSFAGPGQLFGGIVHGVFGR